MDSDLTLRLQQHLNLDNMKIIILSCLLAIVAAAPTPDGSDEHIAILRDDRNLDDDGTYTFDFETESGISRSEQGALSFTFPDGESFELTFVADENGYQPQSDHLPVAPAFPHPIPDFVLEQIEFARNNPISEERK